MSVLSCSFRWLYIALLLQAFATMMVSSSPTIQSRHLLQAGTDCLSAGQQISCLDDPNYLESESGYFFARIECDGVIRIYDGALNARDVVATISDTVVDPEEGVILEVLANGILQIRTADDSTILFMSDNTADDTDPNTAKAVLADDGNLVLYEDDTLANQLWESDTARLFFLEAGNYGDAQELCPFGLYTIRTEEDIDILRQAIEDQGINPGNAGVWVGINNLPGNWVYDDGSFCVTSTTDCEDLPFWEDGEPSTGDCAEADVREENGINVLSSQNCNSNRDIVCNGYDVSNPSGGTDGPTAMPSTDPTQSPILPTADPTSPTSGPSTSPTAGPSVAPSTPTAGPSTTPSTSPSNVGDTASPSTAPSTPTSAPTVPTSAPSVPTAGPSTSPSNPGDTGSPSTSPIVMPPLLVPSSSPTSAPTSCSDHPLYEIFEFIFGESIACSIIMETLPDEILDLLVPLYRDRICLALATFDLTAAELIEFYRLLATTPAELDCDNVDISLSDSDSDSLSVSGSDSSSSS